MRIGNFETDAFAALAPMAGVADRSFRKLCRGYGAAFTVSELISAKAVSMGDKKSHSMLAVSDGERPVAIQLFGSNPDIMAQAAIDSLKYNPDFIDINMGCPAPKVAASGGGAVLMKNPQLAQEIVDAVVKAVDLPITVKMRSGWDLNNLNVVEMAKRCEQAGATAVTVHGRTREQMYAPPVNLDIIAEVKKAVSIPVIANGDIVDAKSAARMYEYTGCDFIMVGRGAMGSPWIFSQINAYIGEGRILPEPPISERMLVLMRQAAATVEDKGERTALLEMRKHAAWYIKGLRGAAAFRKRCGEISTMAELEKLCYDVCKECSENEV